MAKTYIVEKDWITQVGYRAVVIISLNQDGTKRNRCGYVGILPEHPAYQKGYSEQLDAISQEQVDNTTLGKKSSILMLTATCSSDNEFNSVRRSLDILIDCHGGLTYSGGNGKYPVEAEATWWFGFDCAHYDDASIEPTEFDLKYPTGGTVRTLEYVEAECESIAQQLLTI
jgi:hypothetical protein